MNDVDIIYEITLKLDINDVYLLSCITRWHRKIIPYIGIRKEKLYITQNEHFRSFGNFAFQKVYIQGDEKWYRMPFRKEILNLHKIMLSNETMKHMRYIEKLYMRFCDNLGTSITN